MTKVHSTLKPTTNIVIILLWGIIAGFAAYNSRPYSYIVVFVGLILGVFGGIMQSFALSESREAFLNTSSLLDVRRKLKNTKWGKRYIPFLWIGNLAMVAIVVLTGKGNLVIEIMAGYFSLMFVREIITLRATFKLAELSKKNPEPPASQGPRGARGL
jgi:hypothetical protein